MTYVDETRSLTTGNPLDELPNYQFSPDDAEKDDATPETSRKTTPVRSTPTGRDHSDMRGAKPAQARHSPSARVMLPRIKSNEPEYRADEHPRAKSSASPFDTQPWQRNVAGNAPRETSAFPLNSRTEAVLFRHYIAKLAPCVGLDVSPSTLYILTKTSWTYVIRRVTLSWSFPSALARAERS